MVHASCDPPSTSSTNTAAAAAAAAAANTTTKSSGLEVDFFNDPDVDIYALLGLQTTATEQDIKRAYRRKALQYHPDRCKHVDATVQFQRLGIVYEILSNPEKRRSYDAGMTVQEILSDFASSVFADTDGSVDAATMWKEYFDAMFEKVTSEKIEEFEKEYKGSSEELQDLIAVYLDKEGDMAAIIDTMLLGSVDDEPRYRSLLEDAIKEGTVPSFPQFVKIDKKKEEKRRKAAEKEAKEAEEWKAKLGLDSSKKGSASSSTDDLAALIRSRHAGRLDSLVSNLEAKYCPKPESKSKKGKRKDKDADETEMEDQVKPKRTTRSHRSK